MSHPAAWACRSCGLVLGEVRGGALRPLVPVASVDGRGVARVPCPACGRVRAWSPDGARRPPRRAAVSPTRRQSHRPRWWVVVRTPAWPAKGPSIPVRWDRKAANCPGLLKLACVLLWFGRCRRLAGLGSRPCDRAIGGLSPGRSPSARGTAGPTPR
jgi:hypothetical protein